MTAPPLRVLYEDNHLLAVYKPPGLSVQKDASGEPSLQDLARGWIAKAGNKPGNVYLGIVHRLDKPVAGVVLLARTSKAAARLSALFRDRKVDKVYRAVVKGTFPEPRGRLTHYLKKEKSLKATVFPRPTPGAQVADLEYQVIEGGRDSSLLEIRLFTGRFHQIRAQLAFAGHSILGDVKYRAPEPLPERNIALYACRLAFDHPITGERISIEADPPGFWPGVS